MKDAPVLRRQLGSLLAVATVTLMCTALSGGTALAGQGAAPRAVHHHAVDSDHDGIPNYWERAHHTHVHGRDAKVDPDHDGLSNLSEFHDHTLPHVSDTDHDGLADGAEVHRFHTSPRNDDTDHDGISDGEDDSNHDHVADGGEDGNWSGFVGTIISFDPGTGQLLFDTSFGIPLTAVVTEDTRVHVCESCWTDDTQTLLQEGQDIDGLIFAPRPFHGLPVLKWLAVTCPPAD